MEQLLRDLPDAIENTAELSNRLQFSLENLGYEFPKYPLADGDSIHALLRRETMAGARQPSGDDREKLIQYVYKRYGSQGAAMTANVITYRRKSASREMGKVLGVSEDMVDRLSHVFTGFEWKDPDDTLERPFLDVGLDISHLMIRRYVDLCWNLMDLPRHLGQHSGGTIVREGQLSSVVPLEPATMERAG